MRIKLKVSGSGAGALTRFPYIPHDNAELCTGGKLDFAKTSAALGRDAEQIQPSGKDDLPTVALAVEFLRQLNAAARHLTEDAKRDLRTDCETIADRQHERKMERGQYCFVRIDISPRRDATRVRISVGNPREVKGQAPARAYDMAVMCARVMQYLKRELDAHGCISVALEGGEGAERVFDDAAAMGVYDELMTRRENCPRRQNGIYCSPSDFSCPNYINGKCRKPKHPLS